MYTNGTYCVKAIKKPQKLRSYLVSGKMALYQKPKFNAIKKTPKLKSYSVSGKLALYQNSGAILISCPMFYILRHEFGTEYVFCKCIYTVFKMYINNHPCVLRLDDDDIARWKAFTCSWKHVFVSDQLIKISQEIHSFPPKYILSTNVLNMASSNLLETTAPISSKLQFSLDHVLT